MQTEKKTQLFVIIIIIIIMCLVNVSSALYK